MATFLMFGKYSIDSLNEMSAERTEKAISVVRSVGGELKAGYALLGETDLVIIVDFPSVKEAMKAALELSKLLGVSFTTAPALTIEEFDKLIGAK